MNILVTGSSTGLGAILAETLTADGHSVFGYDLAHGLDVRRPNIEFLANLPDVDVLINNAGIDILNWLSDLPEGEWDAVMGTNAKGIYLMTQACLPSLIRTRGTVVNIISDAAFRPMTCTLAYGASKAAAHLMTQQLARELTRKYGITVFGVAPNKLHDTEMSRSVDEQVMRLRGWNRDEMWEMQARNLLTGEETPPHLVARFIAFLLSSKENHKYLTGCVLPYGI